MVVFPASLEIQTIDMNMKGDIFLYFLQFILKLKIRIEVQNVMFFEITVCDYRLQAANMSWGAQQRRTTVASATEMAHPADWCEDTTSPNTIQEKVKNL